MADFLERARLVAEITELRKLQSEPHFHATGDEMRDALIGSLRLELLALDDGEPGLIRGAPRAGASGTGGHATVPARWTRRFVKK